jgi:Fic family protein
MFESAWPDMAGQYRTTDIDAFAPIGDLPPHHAAVPGEMFVFCRDLAQRPVPEDAAAAVELAVWTHMEIVRIHPFQEGNGKTARLALNVLLMRHVTGPTRPLDVPFLARQRYVDAVQDARQGRPEAFHALVADLLDSLVEREQKREERLARRRPTFRAVIARAWRR